jgi:transcriptional regulator with XRE-family HTH domain
MKKLIELRALEGWTQTDLAYRSGVVQATISKIEKGILVGYSVRNMKKLADALGVTVLDIEEFATKLARPSVTRPKKQGTITNLLDSNKPVVAVPISKKVEIEIEEATVLSVPPSLVLEVEGSAELSAAKNPPPVSAPALPRKHLGIFFEGDGASNNISYVFPHDPNKDIYWGISDEEVNKRLYTEKSWFCQAPDLEDALAQYSDFSRYSYESRGWPSRK